MADMEIDKPAEVHEFQEDDEFEEFEIYKNNELEDLKPLDPWEEDWDDDIKQDDFAAALRAELKLS